MGLQIHGGYTFPPGTASRWGSGKVDVKRVIRGTDWRFFNELKKAVKG
jgi:hypothetical protein